MSRKLLVIAAAIILLVLVALYVGVMVPVGPAAARTDLHPDAPPYSTHGPYSVGMRNLAIDGEAPLELTMWYPALNDTGREIEMKYAYTMKMGDPFGAVTFATFAGHVIDNAPYDLTAGPYPLIILSPGFSIGATTYGWLAEHLASYGFVVIAPEHQEHLDAELDNLWQATITRPQDISTVLAYVDEQVATGGTLTGLIDAETVAVMGHSYGGYTALAAGGAQIDSESFETECETAYQTDGPIAWLCDQTLPHMAEMAALAGLVSVPEGLWQQTWADSRIDAIVPMAGDALFFGEDGLAEITVPVMAIGGTRDNDSPYMWGTHPTYEFSSSSAKVRVALVDAEHMIFTGPCEATPLLLRLISDEFCSDPGWDRNYAHNLINHFTTAFLLDTLKGDQSAHEALLPDATLFEGIEYTTTLK